MKGFYVPTNRRRIPKHAIVYKCNHPLYDMCTLYVKDIFGLAVVGEHFNDRLKSKWWGPIDPWLADDIFEQPKFDEVFIKLSGVEENGLYPTIEVRKLMYLLDMKPLKKAYWERGFKTQKIHSI